MRLDWMMVVIVCLGLSGCVFLDKEYQPAAIEKVEAQKSLERLLWAQYRAPKQIEVTDSYFRTGSLIRSKTAYYDDIGDIKLEKKRSMWCVTVYGKKDQELYRYYVDDGDKAKRFIDSISSLKAGA